MSTILASLCPESFEYIFMAMAGLLTCSLLRPSLFKIEKVTEVSKAYKRAYSSGNCTGLAPVSLLGHPSGQMKLAPLLTQK